MWDVGDAGCWGCGMFWMWDVLDVGCWGCGMLGMWDVRNVGCAGCGMWNVCWDVGCSFTKCQEITTLFLQFKPILIILGAISL